MNTRAQAGIPQPTTVEVAGIGTVGYYEYGASDGTPVFALHGVPACGAGFDWADEPARERDVRVIAPDRPGVGLSTARDGWSVADYARDLAVFADTLQIDSFTVWGYSGGGPYTLACASLLGSRVRATAVAAGMGRIGDWATIEDFAKTDRQMLALAAHRPRLARLVMSVASRAARLSPKRALASFDKELAPPDRELLLSTGRDAASIMTLFTQAFLRGARGVVDDYRAVGAPWGFELTPGVGPVSIWHGDADTMVPLSHAQALADRLPESTLTIWPGEGHLGTVNHAAEILDSLVPR